MALLLLYVGWNVCRAKANVPNQWSRFNRRMLSIVQGVNSLTITARQYGEVVLPDASTGQGPGTLATKLSRCKEGMAHFLPSWYKF